MRATLDAIRQPSAAALYPSAVLDGCESALVMFAAAFLGAQDAVWIADAGLTATCVDTDLEKVAEMAPAYPTDWEYVVGDAFDYATRTKRRWDVVSVDCPSNLFERCAEFLPVWCLLARRAVVLGCGRGTEIVAPDGWQVTDRLHRSNFRGGVYWAVLERC